MVASASLHLVIYATAIIMLLSTPVLAIALALVALERGFHLGIFDPTLGGDPLLLQHLFWFYSHPALYIMILPAMSVVSEIVACSSGKRIFGYKFVAAASVLIAVFGFLVWAHHMFVAGMSLYAALVFSLLSYLVAVPSAIKVFNWTATFYKGSLTFSTPMLYALSFIGLFTMGGLTGLFLAALGVNYCRTKVPMGVIEAVNGNIKSLLRRGRGYRDMDYLLLKAQRLAATKTEFLVLRKAA